MPPDADRPGGAGAGGPALLVGAVVLVPLEGRQLVGRKPGVQPAPSPPAHRPGLCAPGPPGGLHRPREMKPPVPARVHLKDRVGLDTAPGLSRAGGGVPPQASASPAWWLGPPQRWRRPPAPPTPFSSPPAQHPKFLGAQCKNAELLRSPQPWWGLPGCRRGPSWAQKRSWVRPTSTDNTVSIQAGWATVRSGQSRRPVA